MITEKADAHARTRHAGNHSAQEQHEYSSRWQQLESRKTLFFRGALKSFIWGAMVLASGLAPAASAFKLTPFEVQYTAKWNNTSVGGDVTTKLEQVGDSRFKITTHASAFFTKVREVTVFDWAACQPKPLTYHYKRGGLASGKERHLTFDWHTLTASYKSKKRTKQFPLTEGITDSLTAPLKIACELASKPALPRELDLNVAEKYRIKTATWHIEGQETLQTPHGPLNAVRLKRIRTDSERITTVWMAPSLNYTFVKLKQIETNGDTYEMNVKKADVNM